MTFKHVYDGKYGLHRIEIHGTTGNVIFAGETSGYQAIAVGCFGDKTYICVTDYRSGGTLNPDGIYEVKEASRG